MPNGADRNWVRLCAAIDGFRSRYGKWPSRIRLFPGCNEDLKKILGPKSYSILADNVELIPDDAPIVAEDDDGHQYSYGKDGFPEKPPDIHTEEWLGIQSLPEYPGC